MHKIVMLTALLLFAGCATTGPDLAASVQQIDTIPVYEIGDIETISSDEHVGAGEEPVCRYEIPAGSHIARKYCHVNDPFDAAVEDMINRDVVERMRETSLRRRQIELDRMVRGGVSSRQ
jgi:hypothetical protein